MSHSILSENWTDIVNMQDIAMEDQTRAAFLREVHPQNLQNLVELQCEINRLLPPPRPSSHENFHESPPVDQFPLSPSPPSLVVGSTGMMKESYGYVHSPPPAIPMPISGTDIDFWAGHSSTMDTITNDMYQCTDRSRCVSVDSEWSICSSYPASHLNTPRIGTPAFDRSHNVSADEDQTMYDVGGSAGGCGRRMIYNTSMLTGPSPLARPAYRLGVMHRPSLERIESVRNGGGQEAEPVPQHEHVQHMNESHVDMELSEMQSWFAKPLRRPPADYVCDICHGTDHFIHDCHVKDADDAKTPYQGPKRCYGEFLCHKCKRKWKSTKSYANVSEACVKCKIQAFPNKQLPLDKAEAQGLVRNGRAGRFSGASTPMSLNGMSRASSYQSLANLMH